MDSRSIFASLKSSKVLILVLGIQAALIVFRSLNLYLTGFQTADEVNYILDDILGAPYGNRYFFGYQLLLLFRAFSVNSIGPFFVFFPFYLAFWTFSFLILAYKTLGLVTQNTYARDFTMLSLPFAISYSILSVGLLSEGPGLTMCMLGIYAWLRYAKSEPRWYYVVISSAAFVAASYCREPYEVFPAAGALAWIALGAVRKVPLRHAVVFVAIALLIAAPNSTFYGASGALEGVPTTVNTPPPVITFTSIVVGAVTMTTTTVINGVTSTITLTTTTTNTTTYVSNIQPQEGFFSGWAQVVANSMVLFLVGVVLGWNPMLFLMAVVAFVYLLRIRPLRNLPWLQIFLMILSLGTFFGAAVFFYNQFNFYIAQGLSNLIRLSNTTIPAYLLLAPVLYERLGKRTIKVVAVILVIFTLGSAGFYVTAVQTNFQLPYNVLDFNHVNSTLEARNYLISNVGGNTTTPVFVSGGWEGGELYLLGIPGVVLYPQGNVPSVFDFSQLLNLSYTNGLFIRYHPTVFYVVSEISLSNWNPNATLATNVQRVMGYQTPFLYKTFGQLFHADASSYGPEPYSIDSVQVIFSSPTGYLLKVHASWNGN